MERIMDVKDIEQHSCMRCIHFICDIEADIPFDCKQPYDKKKMVGLGIQKENECQLFQGKTKKAKSKANV